MASTAANGLVTNLINLNGRYLGIGQRQFPLSSVAGISSVLRGNESGFTQVGSMKFNMSQTTSLDAASQPSITENDTFNDVASSLYIPTQNTNTCNVFREGIKMSEMKLRDLKISGNALAGDILVLQSVQNQITDHINQLKKDYNKSIITGTASDGSSDSDTAFQIAGLYTGISTNKINALNVPLSKKIMKSLSASVKDNGAPMEDPYIVAGSEIVNQVNELFELAERSTMMGGVNLTEILLPIIGRCRVLYDNDIPDGVLLLVDMARFDPVSNGRPGIADIALVERVLSGQGQLWEVMAYLGIDYWHESLHGAIHNIADVA